jgi:hypothetical protein
VKGVHLLAWSASIDRGEATAETPTPSLMHQLMRAHNRSKVMKTQLPVVQTPSSGAPSQYIQFYSGGSSGGGGGIVQGHSNPFARHSSPLQMPSTQSSAIELLKEFMTWLFQDSKWRDEHTKPAAMQLQIDDAGFDVEGIATCDSDTCKEAGLPIPYRVRMKAAAKMWLFERSNRRSPTAVSDFSD